MLSKLVVSSWISSAELMRTGISGRPPAILRAARVSSRMGFTMLLLSPMASKKAVPEIIIPRTKNRFLKSAEGAIISASGSRTETLN